MCSPSPMLFPPRHLLNVKSGFQLGHCDQTPSPLQQLASDGRRSPQAPFPVQPREGQRARSPPRACEGRASRKATRPKRPGSTFIAAPVTLERTTLLAVPHRGHTQETPRDPPATTAGAGHGSLELHRGGSRLPAPCRDATALPENAAAYSRGSGRRNEDLVLQRPLKATPQLHWSGILKKAFRTPTPCARCHGHGCPEQTGAEENTQHMHQPCLSPDTRRGSGSFEEQKMKAFSNLSIGKMQTQLAGASWHRSISSPGARTKAQLDRRWLLCCHPDTALLKVGGSRKRGEGAAPAPASSPSPPPSPLKRHRLGQLCQGRRA